MPIPLLSRTRRARGTVLTKDEIVKKALQVAQKPADLQHLPAHEREPVSQLAKAIQHGSGWTRQGGGKPVSAAVLAQRAAATLAPSTGITPVDIATAMTEQGLDWVQPFPPGQPLLPYYGYDRRPRQYNYTVGRNITTDPRPDRIPFETLTTLWHGYDVAQTCSRYSIQDLRSMRVRFEAMDGYEDNPVDEIAAAKTFLRRPDGKRLFRNWLAQNQLELWKFDSAPIYRLKDKGGRLKSLKNISAKTIAPMVDYFGDFPDGAAPAFQQFIEGIPWDWLRWEDLIYEPFWPQTDSPYGTPPLETVLINANTDVRLQMYFLDFFTSGTVPEAFALAPEDMTSADDLADFQEQYTADTYGTQSKRWGLKWLPHGTELNFYKPQTFDPDLAEYVMRRTIAAFGLVPQNLGLLDDVNRASSDTQMDQQFRISTLPIVGYYEDILDSILQDTLTLPVQIRFDTGREKEDRLMEARAHQVYWMMGAESSDEVREKVLGYAVNPEERIPRTVMDQRLGIIPMAHILQVSGDVDPLTGAPVPGSVEPMPYQLPGGGTPVPAEGPVGTSDTPADAGPKAGRGDPTKAYPRPLDPPATAVGKEASDETPEDSDNDAEYVGWGLWGIPSGSSGSMGHASTHPAMSVAEYDDLRRWQRNARKAVSRGSVPRYFSDSSIAPERVERVWKCLEGARTREAVDAAFAKAKDPKAAGIVCQAMDTGRVLMVQRTPDKHD